jgi:hypothetical protein
MANLQNLWARQEATELLKDKGIPYQEIKFNSYNRIYFWLNKEEIGFSYTAKELTENQEKVQEVANKYFELI